MRSSLESKAFRWPSDNPAWPPSFVSKRWLWDRAAFNFRSFVSRRSCSFASLSDFSSVLSVDEISPPYSMKPWSFFK